MEYKEVSLGQHGQVLLCRRRRLHFQGLSVPAPLLFPLSLIPFFKETKARFSKVLKVRVCE